MVFSSQMTADGFRHIMETNGTSADGINQITRNHSIDTIDSINSTESDRQEVRCTSFSSLQPGLKPSLPSSHSNSKHDISCNELNGATGDLTVNNVGRQAISTGCLHESSEYYTSAKLVDHFPQKVRTPSTSALTPSRSTLISSKSTLSSHSTVEGASKAPVATVEDHDSPDLVRRNSVATASENSDFTRSSSSASETEKPKLRRCHSTESSASRTTEHEGNETGSNKVRFLPAYRAKTVEEMMQDRSPRAVWQHSSKSVQRSQSTRNSHLPNYGYYSGMHPGQPGRMYNTPSPQQNRPYATGNRNRPNMANIRINDGTHPRMPMRAMQPQTLHGMPVHVQQPVQRYASPTSYENPYGTVRRGMPYAQPEAISYNHKAQSHGDMRTNRGRVYSENSPVALSQVDRNIRGANSEPDIEQPRGRMRQQGRSHFNGTNSNFTIPSGQYVASSSMTSLPQYAQLMTPTGPQPQRADSAGNVRRPSDLPLQRELGTTRHSYSVSTYQSKQQASLSSQRVNSYDDVYKEPKQAYSRGSTTPTSPVSRQPSYLTAMTAPVRQRVIPDYQRKLENGGAQKYSEDNVVFRNKQTHQTEEDSHQKILRRTSYLMATSKPEISVEEGQKTPHQKYRKLKKFFGEGTPSIKEAQEKALQSSSYNETFTLPDNLEVHKTGILAVKIVTIEGKKSHSRSWRGMGAVLSRDMLYLVKDKKENATMLTTPSGSLSIDEKPISIIACYVAIAHSYTKRRHVFKLITSSSSEYLLQADDDNDMVEWIKAIEANRHPDKESEQLTSSELVKRINDKQSKLNQLKRRTLGGLSFKNKQPYSSPAKSSDAAQKKEDKKKRNSSGANKQLQFDYNAEPASGDFGIPIHECVPSHENEFVPLIVELCTKAIEDRGLDFVGIYRVPGNKAAVELLKKELNQGIINLDNDKWKDMNVLSSLLKTFFRRLPDSLITTQRYKDFIQTNRQMDGKARLLALKQLIASLPDYNFETLKYLAIHLRKVAEHGEANKMDTRNLAIVFGPTIVKSGDDMMSLVTDMSDQCRIIESLIIYCDWMFSAMNSDPPALDEAEISASCAPISETMNNISAADLAMLASNKNKSKAQLMSALTSAVNKNISKGSLNPNSISSPLSATPPKLHQSPEDDHGFKNRDLQQEAAARNQKLHENRERETREGFAWPSPQQRTVTPETLANERYLYSSPTPHGNNFPRWHSEESVLAAVEHQRVTHDQYPYHSDYKPREHTRHLASSDRLSDGTPPPPIPARGVDIKPPLPPKPMQLYHAKPTHIDLPEYAGEEDALESPSQLYENYEHLKLAVREPAINQPRTLRVIHNQLKSSSLPRRGSLDSMMDTLEPFPQYSSSSSTESQDGSDLLSSITTTFDQKLKLLVDPKFRLDGQGNRRPKTSSDSSSMGSSVLSQRAPPDSPLSPHVYRGSSEQSRESLLSILSNKENMNTCESFSSTQDMQSSDRGFDGSTSSIGSALHRPEAKVGIASRIERKDIKPMSMGYAKAKATKTMVVNATGSVISKRNDGADSAESEDGKDFTNNNSLAIDYDDMPLIQRRMSDEKKRIRRRHTVGGAQDFELLKDLLADYRTKQNMLSEDDGAVEPQQDALTAWQRLQPRDHKEPLSLRDWIERERCRASSPELETRNTPNIMHLQKVGRKLAGSLLESHT